MHVVAIIASITVGVVLLFAGATKFVDGQAWLSDSKSLGVSKPIAVVVPFIECTLGVGLMIGLARPVFALMAATLIGLMTLVLVRKLIDGDPPSCACFGRFSRKQIGVSDVSRNLALISLAVVAAIAN